MFATISQYWSIVQLMNITQTTKWTNHDLVARSGAVHDPINTRTSLLVYKYSENINAISKRKLQNFLYCPRFWMA